MIPLPQKKNKVRISLRIKDRDALIEKLPPFKLPLNVKELPLPSTPNVIVLATLRIPIDNRPLLHIMVTYNTLHLHGMYKLLSFDIQRNTSIRLPQETLTLRRTW